MTIQNFHLQAGNAIAYNPREDRPFKAGDPVFQGEIIGYTGITGNGINTVPHLHLGIIYNGKNVNPELYLNGRVSDDKSTIKGILCQKRWQAYGDPHYFE